MQLDNEKGAGCFASLLAAGELSARIMSRLTRTALLVAVALISACNLGPPPPSPHEVAYSLTWNTEGAQRLATGGWKLTTDLGYTVQLQRGYLISRSMEVTECPKTITTSWIEPRPAFAGHASGTPNPAAILTPHAESLLEAGTTAAGRVMLQPQQYCKSFYLIARADNTTVGLPHDVDMVDLSLYVEGFFLKPGSTDATPFHIRTAIGNGTVLDIFPPGHFADSAAAFHLDTGKEGAEVSVRRDLSTMFTGVDFSTLSEQMMARQVLKNLIDHTEIVVQRTATARK